MSKKYDVWMIGDIDSVVMIHAENKTDALKYYNELYCTSVTPLGIEEV